MREGIGGRRRPARKLRSGETIVEVTVSAVVFLLLVALLQGAVTFASAALEKNKQQRADQTALMEALQTAAAKPSTERATYTFYAYDAAETTRGNAVFSVDVSLSKKEAAFTDSEELSRTVTFYIFD